MSEKEKEGRQRRRKGGSVGEEGMKGGGGGGRNDVWLLESFRESRGHGNAMGTTRTNT